MEDIEVGEYVRTTEGYILKNTIEAHKHIIDNYSEYKRKFGDIAKHSKDVIDLIEVEDYVNRHRVLALTRLNDEEISICIFKSQNAMNCEILRNKDVKSILTKEQYNQNCYRLEE